MDDSHRPSTQSDLLFGIALAWLFPRNAAMRTWSSSLFAAWRMHVLAGVITFLTFLVIDLLVSGDESYTMMNSLITEFEQDPIGMSIVFIITSVVIEGCFVVIAMLLMPWGCRDEPIGRSIANALRQTWLHTTHLIPVLLILSILMSLYGYVEDLHEAEHGSAFNLYSDEAQDEYYRNEPLLLRYGQQLFAVTFWGITVWMLWSVIRGIAADRPGPTESNRDPMCEFCGYNLLMTEGEGRCPECGELVIRSLGDDVRTGPPLMDTSRRLLDRYVSTVMLSIFKPRKLGRMMLTQSRLRGTGLVLSVHLSMCFAAMFARGMIGAIWDQSFGQFSSENYYWRLLFMQILMVCWMITLALMAAVGFFAFLVTVVSRTEARRNLGQVAIAFAAYASALPTLWLVWFCAAYLLVNMWYTPQELMRLFENPYIDEELVFMSVWLVPALIVIGWYVRCVTRGTIAARWANK